MRSPVIPMYLIITCTVAVFVSLTEGKIRLKPAFDLPFENVTDEYGKEHFLICSAEGEEPISYKWYDPNGDELNDDNFGSFISSPDRGFKILSADHQGSYTCTASNAHGQASKVFFIKALPPSGLKPRFDLPFQKVTKEFGSTLSLICTAEGEKPITYKWYDPNGDEITGDNVRGFMKYTLRLVKVHDMPEKYIITNSVSARLAFERPASTEQEGSYTCTASNTNGQASKVFSLRVLSPSGLMPKLDSPSQNVTKEYGSKIFDLRCEAEGEKPMTFKWYDKNGDEIASEKRVNSHEDFSYLRFDTVSTEHDGSYTCTASNVHGQASKVIFLTVLPPSGQVRGSG